MRFLRFSAILISMIAAGPLRAAEPASLVLKNANVITLDEKRPAASAVAARGETIVYVGDDAGAPAFLGPKTEVLDLAGKTVIPGFNDVHVHALPGGLFYLEPNLWGKSCEEIVAVVAEEVKKARPGEIITANSWDYPTCPNPHRKLLDPVSPQNPVVLTQFSGHACWVNSAMLKKLGYTAKTQDPEGGKIDRDPDGTPTGILRDKAAFPAQARALLLVKKERREAALEEALRLFRENGITSVQDNTWDPRTLALLRQLQKEGRLTCRFTCWSYAGYSIGPKLMKLGRYDDPWIRPGPWKLYADGAFSTRTGWMTEAYAGEPDNFGLPMMEPAQLAAFYLKAAKQKKQIAMHAIGDRAAHEVLNAVEKSAARYPQARQLRHRIEHAQIMLPEDIPRLARLGMVAAIQPFAASQPQKDLDILGPERARIAYPYRSLQDAGVPIALGSDLPAEVDFQPLLNIYYAVTRKNKAGDQGPLNPQECLTVEQALRAYTLGSAYAEFMEDKKGSIEVGKLADFAVLSRDPLSVEPAALKDVQVEMTIVGGRIVHRNR